MNDAGFKISAILTATAGVFGMRNNDFAPTTGVFFIAGLIILSLVMGFFGEQAQVYLTRQWNVFTEWWNNPRKKVNE